MDYGKPVWLSYYPMGVNSSFQDRRPERSAWTSTVAVAKLGPSIQKTTGVTFWLKVGRAGL